MVEALFDILTGLWPIVAVGGCFFMGWFSCGFVLRELKRWKTNKEAKKSDVGIYGAPEGAREGAMSRDEAHLYTDECA